MPCRPKMRWPRFAEVVELKEFLWNYSTQLLFNMKSVLHLPREINTPGVSFTLRHHFTQDSTQYLLPELTRRF